MIASPTSSPPISPSFSLSFSPPSPSVSLIPGSLNRYEEDDTLKIEIEPKVEATTSTTLTGENVSDRINNLMISIYDPNGVHIQSSVSPLATVSLSSASITPTPLETLERHHQYHFSQARLLFNEKKWDETLKLLDPLLDKYPYCILALELRMHIYHDGFKDPMKALNDCNQILLIQPTYREALLLRIKIFFNFELYEKAKADVQLILKRNIRDIYALKYMGAILVKERNPNDGISCLQKAYLANRNDEFTLHYLAQGYNQLGYNTIALSYINCILKNNPLDPQILLLRARIYLDLSFVSEAFNDLTKIKAADQGTEYRQLKLHIDKLKKAEDSCCTIC